MQEDQIRLAFAKAKQDIDSLNRELICLRAEITEIKDLLKETLNSSNSSKPSLSSEIPPSSTNNSFRLNSTVRQINSTHPAYPTDNPTVPQEIGGLRYPNLVSSIGNEGVPTDKQTNRQTDPYEGISDNFSSNINQKEPNKPTNMDYDLKQASDILASLDKLKKGIRLKFKQVTPQEMAVFSTIYQLEEQNKSPSSYKQIAKILHLSESSIRDYVQRMIFKGIPIKKQKVNNKQIVLFISEELKKIATLSTIIQLREL